MNTVTFNPSRSTGFQTRSSIPPQQELFAYLAPNQQKTLAHILRELKYHAQWDLCQRLLTFVETGQLPLNGNLVVDGLALFLTTEENGNPLFTPHMGEDMSHQTLPTD